LLLTRILIYSQALALGSCEAKHSILSPVSSSHLGLFGEVEPAAVNVTSGASTLLAEWRKWFSVARLSKRRLIVWNSCIWHCVKVALGITTTLEWVNLAPLLLNLGADTWVPRGRWTVRLINIVCHQHITHWVIQ
jgi:hypothetical protein